MFYKHILISHLVKHIFWYIKSNSEALKTIPLRTLTVLALFAFVTM